MRNWVGLMIAGVGAVTAKELRGRMRGWRAFAVMTVYLGVLAGFVLLIYFAQRSSAANGGFSSATAIGSVGQGIFQALMVLQLILVVFLAPAFTTGAISLEREKQTLDLLIATPVPSPAVVLGKLISALAFLAMQVLASLPLVAVVFVFGGVAPDDLVRGYLVLLVSGLGFGCIGLGLSAIVKRTQTATVLTWLTALALTLGTAVVFYYWDGMARQGTNFNPPGGFDGAGRPLAADGTVIVSNTTPPPQWMLWLNPGLAMGDVLCGADVDPYSAWCTGVSRALNLDPNNQVMLMNGVRVPDAGFGLGGKVIGADGGVFARQVIAGPMVDPTAVIADANRDRIWPTIATAWLILSLVLVAVASLLVRPRRGRRLRLGRPHLRRRTSKAEVAA